MTATTPERPATVHPHDTTDPIVIWPDPSPLSEWWISVLTRDTPRVRPRRPRS